MKLYLFQCGWIKTKKHLLVKDRGFGEPYVVPVPFFLVEHPEGNLLFDMGQSFSELGKHYPGDANYIPVMAEDDYVVAQLRKVGLRSSDITHVVISHMHGDHIGGLGEFQDAVHFLRQAELQQGANPALIGKAGVKMRVVGAEKFHDVFGDGKVRLMSTPGHTAGHQSLLLSLETWGPTLLTADAVYTRELLEGAQSGVACDYAASNRTLEEIRMMMRNGVKVVTGHDPEEWSSFTLAPGYVL